ncbi:hypothetical protein LINPERPRIM_LOCUS9543 [Linum perenne]
MKNLEASLLSWDALVKMTWLLPTGIVLKLGSRLRETWLVQPRRRQQWINGARETIKLLWQQQQQQHQEIHKQSQTQQDTFGKGIVS